MKLGKDNKKAKKGTPIETGAKAGVKAPPVSFNTLTREQQVAIYGVYEVSERTPEFVGPQDITRLAKSHATLADVAIIVRAMSKTHNGLVEDLINKQAILERVLEAKGATDKDFEKAESQWKQELKDFEKEAQEAVKKAQEEAEKSKD